MKLISKIIIFLASFLIIVLTTYYLKPLYKIEEYNEKIDRQAVIDIFYDNWYWMVTDEIKRETYPFIENLDKKMFSGHPVTIKVARVKGKTAGVLMWHPTDHKDIAQVLFLIVDKNYRRLGIAKGLLLNAMKEIEKNGYKKIYLLTRQDNMRSQNLYKSTGFIFLEDHEDGTSHFIYNL